MITSMTGFGAVSEEVEGVRYALELRSLNNRYFKITLRLPEDIAGLEAELEAQVRRRLSRGSITLMVKTVDASAAAAAEINDAALLRYLEHLETIHGRIADKSRPVQIDLTALLALPGVLRPAGAGEVDPVERARPVLMRLLDRACDRLQQMRQTEGKAIADDLTRQVDVIGERSRSIRLRGPEVVKEYHDRLRVRIDELLAAAQLKVDEPTLLRELAVFADRSDVNEELHRLEGHVTQMRQMIASTADDPAGRTLEFIAQEMLREANTLSSKSADAQISRDAVEIKTAIDRIKEQAQNVE